MFVLPGVIMRKSMLATKETMVFEFMVQLRGQGNSRNWQHGRLW